MLRQTCQLDPKPPLSRRNLALTFPFSEQTARKISFRWSNITAKHFVPTFCMEKISFSSFCSEAFCFGFAREVQFRKIHDAASVWVRVCTTLSSRGGRLVNGFRLDSRLKMRFVAAGAAGWRDPGCGILLRHGRGVPASLVPPASVESLCGF